MNGRGRVLNALAHQQPGRVPLYEGAFSDRLASQVLGREVSVSSDGGSSFRNFLIARVEGDRSAKEAAQQSARDGVDLYAQLGIDMIRVRVTAFLAPVDIGYGNYGANFLFDVTIEEAGPNR